MMEEQKKKKKKENLDKVKSDELIHNIVNPLSSNIKLPNTFFKISLGVDGGSWWIFIRIHTPIIVDFSLVEWELAELDVMLLQHTYQFCNVGNMVPKRGST